MRHRARVAAAVGVLLGVGGLAAPASASDADGVGEPPGLQSRDTHLTRLTTSESGCVEVSIPRAVTAAGARALVPERYAPTLSTSATPTSTVLLLDYVCDDLSVDRQSHAVRTQVAIVAVALASRDGVPTPGSYYLTSIETDNPVLAARYAQVGLPATFDRTMSAVTSAPDVTPATATFELAGPGAHTVTAVAPVAPVEQPTTSGLTLYTEGGAGEVVLDYANTTIGSVPAAITADYREHQTLAPIVALPRLVQIPGVTFPRGLTRGSWTSTVARLD